MRISTYPKTLSWNYEVPPDSGIGGSYTFPGLVLPPRSLVFADSFAYVDTSFVGLPGAAFGLGLVGTPGQFLSLSLLATLTAGTIVFLNGTAQFFPNGGIVTNDILGTVTGGKITAVLFYDQLP